MPGVSSACICSKTRSRPTSCSVCLEEAWWWRLSIVAGVAVWAVAWGPAFVDQARRPPSWIPYATPATIAEAVNGTVDLYDRLAIPVLIGIVAGGRPGPIMAQVVLADEINRATPKTQSALLEAMEERQATIDGTTYAMPDPFLVIATQNPIEYEGTFALPEAQLDRFMLRIRLGYPQPIEEVVILDEQKRSHPLEELEVVCSVEELTGMQNAIRDIYVDSTVADYIVRLVNGTRNHPDVYLGASPRGSIALYRAGQALAGLLGRDYVIPDDVKALAEPALAHRLIIKTSASIHDVQAANIIRELLDATPIEGIRPTGGPGGPRAIQPASQAASA